MRRLSPVSAQARGLAGRALQRGCVSYPAPHESLIVSPPIEPNDSEPAKQVGRGGEPVVVAQISLGQSDESSKLLS